AAITFATAASAITDAAFFVRAGQGAEHSIGSPTLCDRHLRRPVCARNYPDVVRRNPGQFGFEEVGARSTFRAADRPEIRSGTRSDGADFALADSAKFWTYDAAVRAALSFQRMHQQLSVLRFLAR